ncbi:MULTISPECIES: MarR family transcriptional regulator [Bacillaceae]|uniref:Transcriptional regulator n=1 Tax=Domibacillus aminovorans TaxID=29332 RepID=A0A177KNT5_9BACI|nr:MULTISPECIES: MarR family transcriptional regulator [Bacillaceae]OAH55022.1 transcriptional regulator [Domibacillus aminovorans]
MNRLNQDLDEELALKLFIVLTRANHSVEEKIKEDIRNHGLNPTEFAVLEFLFHKGDQPMQQIGKRILLKSGSTTYVIDKLEEKRLLCRKHCSEDRRVIYVEITDEGKQLIEDIFPKHKKTIQKIFEELNKDEKQTMISLLKKLGLPLQNQ